MSRQIFFEEGIKETTKASEEFDANGLTKTEKDVKQNFTLSEPNSTVGNHEQTPLISAYELDSTVSFKDQETTLKTQMMFLMINLVKDLI